MSEIERATPSEPRVGTKAVSPQSPRCFAVFVEVDFRIVFEFYLQVSIFTSIQKQFLPSCASISGGNKNNISQEGLD